MILSALAGFVIAVPFIVQTDSTANVATTYGDIIGATIGVIGSTALALFAINRENTKARKADERKRASLATAMLPEVKANLKNTSDFLYASFLPSYSNRAVPLIDAHIEAFQPETIQAVNLYRWQYDNVADIMSRKKFTIHGNFYESLSATDLATFENFVKQCETVIERLRAEGAKETNFPVLKQKGNGLEYVNTDPADF